METSNQTNTSPESQQTKNWFSKQMLGGYAFLVVIFLVILFLSRGYLIGPGNKDTSVTVGQLMRDFIIKSDSDTTNKIRFPQGTIRLTYTNGQQNLLYKKTGETTEKQLSTPSDTKSAVNDGSSIYVAYPYLFQVRTAKADYDYNTGVMIYDLEDNTYQYIDLDTCSGADTTQVAYATGKIYWHQSKEWSSCAGDYQKSFKLAKPIVDSSSLSIPAEYQTVAYTNSKYGYEFTYPDTAKIARDKETNADPKLSQQNIIVTLADNADFSVNVFLTGKSDFYLHNIESVKNERECYPMPNWGKPAWQCNNPRSAPEGVPLNNYYTIIFTDKYIYQMTFKEDDARRSDHAELMGQTNKIYNSFKIH